MSVRFWDTSALVKVFDARENDHRRALSLWSGPAARRFQHATSILVAIESARWLYRAIPSRVAEFLDALDDLNLVDLDGAILPVAIELAKRSYAGGADTAIVATALALVRRTAEHVEIVTADLDQADLARSESLVVVHLAGA